MPNNKTAPNKTPYAKKRQCIKTPNVEEKNSIFWELKGVCIFSELG